jgi:hypothetical protein
MTTLQETIRRQQPKGDPDMPAGAADLFHSLRMPVGSTDITTYLATKANKDRFNNYVKHERIDRTVDNRIKQKMRETGKQPPKTLEEIEKDLDLGMQYDIGVPKFESYQETDPLYVERPIA